MSLKTEGSLKFNPPKEEGKKLPRYASYSAGIMKTHTGIGHAKSSLDNRMWSWQREPENKRVTSHSFILEIVDGEYFTLYEILPGLTRNQLPWVKEGFTDTWGRWTELTDYYRQSSYYGPKLESGQYTKSFRSVQMTTDEYVEWRLRVEHERLGIKEK